MDSRLRGNDGGGVFDVVFIRKGRLKPSKIRFSDDLLS